MVARQYFSHVSPGGTDARQRILRAGYLRTRPRAKLGETIAWGAEGAGTPAELVRSFMRSDDHRRTLLDPATATSASASSSARRSPAWPTA